MHDNTVTTNIVIDSSQRDTTAFPSPAHFAINIPLVRNVSWVKLRNFAIYASEYIVNTKNRTLVFTASSVDYTVTLTQGNYTAVALASELQTRMNAAGSGVTFTITYTSSTNKITIASTAAVIMKWSLYPNSARLLGFEPVNDSSATTRTSARQMNVAPTKVLYIAINEFVHAQYTRKNFIAAIVMSGAPGDLVTHNKSYYHTIIKLASQVHVNQLHITIYDENFQVWEPNGIDIVLDVDLCGV